MSSGSRCTGGGFTATSEERMHEWRHAHRWPLWLVPLTGLVALIWFLIRVVPKPARAAYPCQRVAAPLAGSFLLWLVGVLGVALVYHRARALLNRVRTQTAAFCLAAFGAVGLATVWLVPTPAVSGAELTRHGPLGTGRGVHPGRVVWVYDPNATNWAGTNYDGQDIGDGYWWQSSHTDQAVVDHRLVSNVRGNHLFHHGRQRTPQD